MQQADRQGVFLALMGLLFLLSWFALWSWEASPYGRYLNHGQWTEIGASGGRHMHAAHGSDSAPGHALLYVGGWMLMITAMMLPTTMPLLEAVRRLTRSRPDRRLLLSMVIGGYVVAWGVFGIVAHGLDGMLRVVVPKSEWFSANGWVFGVIVFGFAGLFQFSQLKYRCLDKCRAPLSFVVRRWNGQNPVRQAFMLGLGHGAYCVGCCWALMLLMFVLGTGSVGWMLLLAAVMAAEKNLPFGRRLAAPLGIALLGVALVTAVYHTQSGLGYL